MNSLKKQTVSRIVLAAATIALSLSLNPSAWAQITGSELIGNFETLLNQNNTTYVDPTVGGANVGPNACVPTAFAQGLSYLEGYANSQSLPDPFTTSPNNVAAINALAGAMTTAQNSTTKNFGTTVPNRVAGGQSYLAGTGAYIVGGQYDPNYSAALSIGPVVQSTMQATSVANFIAGGLQANDGVEFNVLWGTLNGSSAFTGTGGGHFLTAQSINYNATTGTGTIQFIDPGNATLFAGTLTKTTAGNLYVTYGNPVPVANVDDGESTEETALFEDGAGAAQGGIILNDLAEAVPEPSPLLLSSIGGLIVALRLRFRKQA